MKIQKQILSILFSCVLTLGYSQNYKASLIPDSLKINADVVKRLEELHVVIKSIDKAIVKHKFAITILNEKGDEFAHYLNDYTSLISLTDITGHLYDGEGKLIRGIKKKDIADLSATDDESLLTDRRVKQFAFYNKSYPYTVEFEDEQDYSGIYSLPEWQPVEDERFAVQQSRFIVEVPLDYQLRIKQFNYDEGPVVTTNKTTIYSWKMLNRKAFVSETFQPSALEIIPVVYIAPSVFSIAGYSGSMTTWLELGQFISSLNRKRDELPDKIKEAIHQLTDNVSDRTEKIKILYHYMQQNTRYISVQLGVGSWQPFEARFVAEKKYGDCKALSNYMVSIFKEAGIKANYVLVNAGRGKKGLTPGFPAPYFNHVICCVPNGKDSIWLECTSQTDPAGFMGSFTGDRQALLVDDDGGHVVNTPSYKADDNRQVRKIIAEIDADGNMEINAYTRFTGIQQELQHSLIHGATKEEREKYLNQKLSLATYTVDKSEYKEIPAIIPEIDEYLHVKASNYATVTGKRMFVLPNVFNRSTTRLPEDAERRFPIRFSESYRDIDTIFITVPAGYVVEAGPKNISIEDQFGKYSIGYKIENDRIEVIRNETSNRQMFPSSEYPALVKHFDGVYKADHTKIVFVKKE